MSSELPAAGTTDPSTESTTGAVVQISTPCTASTMSRTPTKFSPTKRVIDSPVICWITLVTQRGPPTA